MCANIVSPRFARLSAYRPHAVTILWINKCESKKPLAFPWYPVLVICWWIWGGLSFLIVGTLIHLSRVERALSGSALRTRLVHVSNFSSIVCSCLSFALGRTWNVSLRTLIMHVSVAWSVGHRASPSRLLTALLFVYRCFIALGIIMLHRACKFMIDRCRCVDSVCLVFFIYDTF